MIMLQRALHALIGTAMLLPQHSAYSFPERSGQRRSAPVRTITDKPTPEFNAIAGTCIVLVQRLHDPDDGIDSWKSITICAAWMDWRVKAPQSGCLPDENDSCVSRVRINPQKTALFPRCERLAARAGRA
jgi:hypothetical protein